MPSRDRLMQRQRLYEEIDRLPEFAAWVILRFAFFVIALAGLPGFSKRDANAGGDCDSVAPTVSAMDLAGDLAGCLDGGPSDLSTNSHYMQGFGS